MAKGNTPVGGGQPKTREARLAEALRANLRRRKAAAKARTGAGNPPNPAERRPKA